MSTRTCKEDTSPNTIQGLALGPTWANSPGRMRTGSTRPLMAAATAREFFPGLKVTTGTGEGRIGTLVISHVLNELDEVGGRCGKSSTALTR